MAKARPRHGVRLWCATCATPATFILPHVRVEAGALFRTRALTPCTVCCGVDYQNRKRVILTAADRRFLQSLHMAWEAPEVPFRPGARVRLLETGSAFPVLGRLRKVSPVGYVIVDWDEPLGADAHFSPHTAARRLQVVVGEEATPRHHWETDAPMDDLVAGRALITCLRCRTVQSDANWTAACAAAPRPGGAS